MHLFFQACFIAISLVLTVNGVKSIPSCAKAYEKKMACNLICNFMLDSDANDAMKILQAKLGLMSRRFPSPHLFPLVWCVYQKLGSNGVGSRACSIIYSIVKGYEHTTH